MNKWIPSIGGAQHQIRGSAKVRLDEQQLAYSRPIKFMSPRQLWCSTQHAQTLQQDLTAIGQFARALATSAHTHTIVSDKKYNF